MPITNKEQLRKYIHGIHNFIRNSGAGYGMIALKIFYLFYGLKLLEHHKNNILNNLSDNCKFSKLRNAAESCKSDEDYNKLLVKIKDKTIDELFKNDKTKDLFHELPTNLSGIGKTYAQLIIKIQKLFDDIENGGYKVDLRGKVYEYFIGFKGGNDQKSELGQHFTDRHISEYCLNLLDQDFFKGDNVQSMIDPYGGSGGFTLTYVNRFENIKWTKDLLNQIHHYDISDDVVKCVALEIFAITGNFPDRENNFKSQNSFTTDFGKKYKLVLTNPPYGGDKTTKSPEREDGEAIINHIKTNHPNEDWAIEQVNNIKISIKNEQDENKLEQVNYTTCSNEIKKLIEKHKLEKNCNDKESCSLIHLMDLLDEGGTTVAVLKEGVFFDSKYSGVRKALIDNFDVKTIVSIPSDTFENTTTKTSIIHFVNNGQRTKKIDFLELKVDKVEEDKFVFCEENQELIRIAKKGDIEGKAYPVPICSATYEQLSHITKTEKKGKSKGFNEKQEYSLSSKKYDIKITTCSDDYKLVKLGDLCEIENGSQLDKKNIIDGPYPVFGGGSKIVGNHNKYNNENCIIISGTGSIGHVTYHKDKFWASQCITIKNFANITYLYNFLKTIEEKLKAGVYSKGSVQKFIRINDIQNLDIPIPKDDKKLEHWVKTIGEPFTIFTEGKEKLKDFEEKIQEEIKDIIEKEDCDEVKLGDLCEFIKSGKPINKDKRTGSVFPYYASNGIVGYVDNYLFDGKFIICAQDGSIGSTYLVNRKFYASNHVWILKIKENIINILYYMMKYMINYKNLIGGSVIPKLNKVALSNIKIKIPKNKSIIEALEPKFKQIEELQENINNAEKEYHFQLEELNKDINLIEKREGKEESKIVEDEKEEEDNKVSKQELEQVITETVIEESIETNQVETGEKVSEERRKELLKLKNSDLYEICQEKGITCTKRTNKRKLVDLLLKHELENKEEEIQIQKPKKRNRKKETDEKDIKAKRNRNKDV